MVHELKPWPMVHELKTWPQYFMPVWQGLKSFEIRYNDRNYQVGDSLILKEWNVVTGYSGREIHKRITYILGLSGWPKVGYIIMALVDAKGGDS